MFLLGREIQTPEDVQFLASVVSEKPCLSFENCTQEMPGSRGDEADHHASINSISLSYPEITAFNAVKNFMERTADRGGGEGESVHRDLRAAAQKLIDAARSSENPLVASRARGP